MRLKKGVDVFGICPELVFGMLIVNQSFEEFNAECVLTSVTDGKHSPRSLHYKGMAFDCRTRDLAHGVADAIVDDIRAHLPQDWDVVLESTHLHIEYDRKR
jgi:hypothetical protein